MEKRIASLCAAVLLGFMGLMLKIASVNSHMYSEAAQSQRTRVLEIGTTRGKIYDRNMRLLVDKTERTVAAAAPTAEIYPSLLKAFGEKEAREKIQCGKPLVFEPDAELNCESARSFHVPERYGGEALAVHLVGYLDSSGQNGLSGVEKAYNGFLRENAGRLSVGFEVDAKGRALLGLGKTVSDDNFNSRAGVVLTIDSEIQQSAENALADSVIKNGCALVMHVDTGEIYAMASVPEFDQKNPAKSLSQPGSPFVNKALQGYSVGSVFKPLVAAAALENGVSPDFEYECTGSIRVGDTTFKCFDGCAHGKQNMRQALENSCNTYFIKLMEQTDPDLLLALCRSAGMGSETQLCDFISACPGRLPENEDLIYAGERANFAFGQGKLLATPAQLLSAYHMLATGRAVKPTVLRGFADSRGIMKQEREGSVNLVLSQRTVLKMREMLSSVVENGNAEKAKSELAAFAGKTGTAQSGTFKGKTEVCRTWFCGFFPADNPHYIVVVLNEDGSSGSADCAPVFKKICEAILRR